MRQARAQELFASDDFSRDPDREGKHAEPRSKSGNEGNSLRAIVSSQIGHFVVDFVCSARRLIVELDESQQAMPENMAADRIRTRFLESRGFRWLRFWNSDVATSETMVLDMIWRALDEFP
jgi:very-short-patch-repair endonuclease